MSETLPVQTVETVGAMEIDAKLNQGYDVQTQNIETDANGIKRMIFVVSKRII